MQSKNCHCFLLWLFSFFVFSQTKGQAIGVPVEPLGDGPWVFDTAEQHKIRVSILARGMSHPWAIAFLPDGLLYLLTDEDSDGALLRIEPISEAFN